MAPRAKKATPQPDATPPAKTYMLRTCTAAMTAYGGFLWPESGLVEAPDWKPTKECGNGLHGLLMGEGDGSLLSWEPDAKWLVVEVDASTVVELNGKVKVPRGDVVFCGERGGAITFLTTRGGDPSKLPAGQASASGDQGQASASGDQGQASASGDQGQASASGVKGQASASGYQGQASASGVKGQASASGYQGQASAAGKHGLSVAERVAAGEAGAIIARWWDGAAERFRYTIGYVGENGIEPYFWYALDEVGAWRKGEPLPDALLPPSAVSAVEAQKAAMGGA